MQQTNRSRHRHITSFQVISLGFLSVILLGSLLLMLPIATKSGQCTSFLDALFTATSAVCVTGLVVNDTATYWSLFGQGVILLLIQIGGMGIITIAIAIAVVSGRKIGLMQRSTMQEAISAPTVGGIVRRTQFIIRTTILIEIIGAVLLAPVFCRDFGFWKGIWYSLFHSISAFCNAGFDLMGYEEAYASLVSFEGDVLVNMVVMFLILTGGIGFIVWDDLIRNKWHFKKYLLHTKIVLTFTIGLTVIATIAFLVLENHGVLAGLTPVEKALGAAFCSVTPRTAGFNTTDVAGLSNAGKLLTILLMFIGGSPGSTAGGAKTTTIVVLLLYAVAMIRNHEDINLFGRRLPDDVVKKANAVVVTNFMLAALAAVIIMAMQPFDMADVLLEVFSAINTVGMSTGITRDLNTVSRLILIVLMYCGRLGSLSFALVFAQKNTSDTIRLPQEKIIVG